MSALAKVFVVVGTRPEVVKMAPVVRAIERRSELAVVLCEVGQQKDVLELALREQGLRPSCRVACSPGPLLRPDVVGRLAREVEAVGARMILVHGDTTTTVAGACAALRTRIPFGHVEAGLRSGDLGDPYPEEHHRCLIGRTASIHYAPTDRARLNLLRERVEAHRILVTGNTVVDALQGLTSSGVRQPRRGDGNRLIVVTLHRRESFGAPLAAVCRGLRRVVSLRGDVEIMFVLHPNPAASEAAVAELEGAPRTTLVQPMAHRSFVRAMSSAYVIVTDSGGVQEEAPYLGIPVLVVRDRTERPEAVEAGVAQLVGRSEAGVSGALLSLLGDAERHARMARVVAPFGVPGASEIIARDLERRLAVREAG